MNYYLDYSNLNKEMLDILTEKHKQVLMCISGNCGKYAYNKLLNETLWRFDLEILIDMGIFFALQNMFELAEFINKAIELKTIIYIKKDLLKINC